MVRDCKIISEKNNIKFKFNSYFPIKSLNLMRGVFVAMEDDFLSHYIDQIFKSIWRDGLNMNDQNIIDKVIKNLSINPKTFSLRLNTPNNKEILKKKEQVRLLKKAYLVHQLFLLIINYFGVMID